MSNTFNGLFSDMVRAEPRKAGILPSQEIRELVRNGKIRSTVDISDDQIQPASVDLRLGNIAYQVRASFLPSKNSLISTKQRAVPLGRLHEPETPPETPVAAVPPSH